MVCDGCFTIYPVDVGQHADRQFSLAQEGQERSGKGCVPFLDDGDDLGHALRGERERDRGRADAVTVGGEAHREARRRAIRRDRRGLAGVAASGRRHRVHLAPGRVAPGRLVTPGRNRGRVDRLEC